MGDATAPPPDEHLAGLVPLLSRLAFQLTGDADAALDSVAAVLSRRQRRRGPADDPDRRLVGAVVRAARRRRPTPTETPLDGLDLPARACVVLAFGWGWDPTTIAEVLWSTPRRVRRHVATALAAMSSDDWRDLLAAPRWSLQPPAGFQQLADTKARHDRRHRRQVLVALGSVATAVAGVLVTVNRVVYAPPQPPAAAHAAGLLPWVPRGPLVDDVRFVTSVVAAWRAAPEPPYGEVFVLYAGSADGRRLAVAQAVDASGAGRLAVVTDAADRGGPARLAVRSVGPLSDAASPAVVVPSTPSLPPSSGVDPAYARLLVAPGVIELSERPPGTPTTPDARPGFAFHDIVDGLSEPWPSPAAGGGTAVHLVRADGSTYRGILVAGATQPLEVGATAQPPPRRWAGLSRTLDPEVLADDVLWWAQACASTDPDVRLVWVGGAPAFPARVRMELVRCRGVGSAAVFLTGATDGSVLLSSHRGRADAYATEFPGLPSFGLGTLLVVASARVSSIRIGTTVVRHRVVRLPLREAGPVRAYDGARHRLVVR